LHQARTQVPSDGARLTIQSAERLGSSDELPQSLSTPPLTKEASDEAATQKEASLGVQVLVV